MPARISDVDSSITALAASLSFRASARRTVPQRLGHRGEVVVDDIPDQIGVDLEVIVNNDLPQPGDRCPGRSWIFGLDFAKVTPHRLADHCEIAKDGVIRDGTVTESTECDNIL